MIQLFKAGRVEHMFVLRGTANVAPGGVVELYHNQSGPGKVVFQAHKRPEGDWAVKYMHPLSCFQAFNICISIFHNPTTQGLDALPAGEARPPLGTGTGSGSGAGGQPSTAVATATLPKPGEAAKKEDAGAPGVKPPLTVGGIELAAAKPGSIINTASLEGLPHQVYSMTVQAAKVYSGLYNGYIQVRVTIER